MNDIEMIEYTIEVKARSMKVSLPAFVTSWEAVYDMALEAAYKNRLWERADLSCKATVPYVEHPKLEVGK